MGWQYHHGNNMAMGWQCHHGNHMMAMGWQYHGNRMAMGWQWQAHANIMATTWQLPCYCHVVAMLLPCYCHALGGVVVALLPLLPLIGAFAISHHGMMSPARVELVLNCLKMLRCHRLLSCDPASKVGKMVLLGISLVTWTDAARRKPLGQPPQRGVVEPLHLHTSRAPSQGNSRTRPVHLRREAVIDETARTSQGTRKKNGVRSIGPSTLLPIDRTPTIIHSKGGYFRIARVFLSYERILTLEDPG